MILQAWRVVTNASYPRHVDNSSPRLPSQETLQTTDIFRTWGSDFEFFRYPWNCQRRDFIGRDILIYQENTMAEVIGFLREDATHGEKEPLSS